MNLLSILAAHRDIFELAQTDAAAALAALNVKSIDRVVNDLQTIWGFGYRYGSLASRAVLGFLDAAGQADPGVKAAFIAICSRGLDLGTTELQGQIAYLITLAPDEVKPALALLAEMGTKVSIIEAEFGISKLATADELTAGINAMLAQDAAATAAAAAAEVAAAKQQLINLITTRHNRVYQAIQNGDVTTEEQAVALYVS